jgi:hypothetical protein
VPLRRIQNLRNRIARDSKITRGAPKMPERDTPV